MTVDRTKRIVRHAYGELADTPNDLPEQIHDLLAVSRAVAVIDRSQPRGPNPDDPRWHRHLHIRVGVNAPHLWKSRSVGESLLNLLNWLTDDHWRVDFHSGREQISDDVQLHQDFDIMEREVLLFSGGLDAVAGAAALMEQDAIFAVGVTTNTGMTHYQRRAIAALASSGLGDIRYVPIGFEVAGGSGHDEPTRRSRGLVFLAAGVAAAVYAGRDRLLLAENGVGAINLPFSLAQHGVMTTRSVHPKTLLLMSTLTSTIMGRQFDVVNPFAPYTKGEMVAQLPLAARSAVEASQSCDNAASGRGNLQRRCGYCTSCLLRRLSLSAAGRTNWDGGPYLSDTKPDRTNRSRVPDMLWQAARLERALRSERPDALMSAFPELQEVPPSVLTLPQLERLFARYVGEWRQFPHPEVSRYLEPTTPRAG